MTSEQLSSLYEQYGYLIHQRCLTLLRRRADADDALQDVFLRLQRYPPKDLERSPLPWLYRVASHCCFDRLKSRGRDEAGSSGVEERDGDEGARLQPSHGSADDADRRALLGAVLRSMDEKTRHIAVLYFLDGMTQDEIAEEVGFSRRTIIKKLALFEQEFQERWSKGWS